MEIIPHDSPGTLVIRTMLCSASICYGISICVSHSWFVSKWLNVSGKFFYHLIAPSF